MPDWLPELLAAAFATILAITLHEAAHGYAALARGDDTALRLGRVSLNPLRHVDPVGTIALPLFLVVSQLVTIGRVEAVFGWAKPVPVNIWQLRNPRWDMVIVAAAGPAMNFALALLAGLLIHVLTAWQGVLTPEGAQFALRAIGLIILANLVLGLFNLFPLPPLDGGRILVGILPRGPAMALASLERYGLLIVILGLFVLPAAVPAYDPMRWFLREVVAPAFDLVLMLTGNGGK
ncbi:MAG: site-2 protease family protein [Paracoccaceae bacterium]